MFVELLSNKREDQYFILLTINKKHLNWFFTLKFYVDPTFTCMLHTKKDFDWISNTLTRRAIIHVIDIGVEHKITLYYYFFFCHETFKISKCWKVPQESEELMAKMQQCDCKEIALKPFISLRIGALCIFFRKANCNWSHRNQYYVC